MNGFVKFALGVAGLPPAAVADIDKAIPGAARTIEALRQLEPYLEQAHPHIEAITPLLEAMAPHVQALLPILDKAMPILKAAYPDIVALLPTAQEIIAFVGEKKSAAVAQKPDASKLSVG
jgi:hypothetical protein